MIPFEHLLWIVPFCCTMGMIFSETFGEWNRKKVGIKTVKKEEEAPAEEKDNETLMQMSLRNGYGVTKDRNPTFAEQWVNIMNFNGESQREENYEE